MTAEEILSELIHDFSIEDFIYEVRNREALGWKGPSVLRYDELMKRAKEIIQA
jgi:hypothetical protein